MRILAVQKTEHNLITNQENFVGKNTSERKGNSKEITMAVR
jgi:hypothetical protein